MRPNLWKSSAPGSGAELLDGHVQQQILARIEDWIVTDLDERIIELVERRITEETERRAWRRGTEVF